MLHHLKFVIKNYMQYLFWVGFLMIMLSLYKYIFLHILHIAAFASL